MWSILRWFSHDPYVRPVPLGDDLLLVSQDRDNYFVSKDGKVAQVYAPHASWFGSKLDFHGVVSERWHPPFQGETITPDDKRTIENALLEHLRRKGCNPVWIVEAPKEPTLQVTHFED